MQLHKIAQLDYKVNVKVNVKLLPMRLGTNKNMFSAITKIIFNFSEDNCQSTSCLEMIFCKVKEKNYIHINMQVKKTMDIDWYMQNIYSVLNKIN